MSRHGLILACLTFLFAVRVLGQARVAFLGAAWLPPMEAWFSGLIPYPTLLAIQIAMLSAMIKIVRDVWSGTGCFAGAKSKRVTRFLIGFSAVYAASMVLRYAITMALHPERRWLGGTIPIFFHFVLAGFIYTLGCYYSAPRKP